MEILFGDFNEKLGKADIFKPINGNDSLQKDSNDNDVRIVNYDTSKNLIVKSTIFPRRNIHKCTWTYPDGKTHNQTEQILKDGIRVYWIRMFIES
jgi:hypothetical protein